MGTVTCPRCGTSNREDEMNCQACRINLRFALENPAEMERIKRDDAERKRLRSGVVTVSLSRKEPILLPKLLLLGSFVFAFCQGWK